MATAAALIAWAKSQIGVKEDPPGSNRVRYWDDAGMPDDQGQPWCAVFVLAGLETVGVGPVSRAVFVPYVEDDYKRANRYYPPEQGLPGDQVCYQFGQGHTGIVVSVDPKARTLIAIEGNTSSGTSGSQDNGGGVFQRTRPFSLVHGMGRPKFDPAKQPEVKPMHNPPWVFEPIVDDIPSPTGGAWLLAASGAVYAVGGAPFHGAPHAQPYFAGRTAAEFGDLTPEEVHAGKFYVVLSTHNERYAF